MAAVAGAQAVTSVPARGNTLPDDSELCLSDHATPIHGEPLGYVPDDPELTVDGYIASVPRHWSSNEVQAMRRVVFKEPINGPAPYFIPPLRFRYRPMTAEEKYGTPHPGCHFLYAVDGLVDRIKAWDLKGPDGVVLPISKATMRRLRPELFGRLAGIVVDCDQTSDPMPDGIVG